MSYQVTRKCRKAGTFRRALTLVEVVVLVGVAALGAVTVGPVLNAAHDRAREVTCETILQGFGTNMALYAADNIDYFPGVNTSGVALRVKQASAMNDPDQLHDASLPVQMWDFMTPLAQYDTALTLPDNRAARWHLLWTAYRCPKMSLRSTVYSATGAPDREDFWNYIWPACSYLMPAYFSYWGTDHQGIELAKMEVFNTPVVPKCPSESWNVSSTSFFSRLDQVGPMDRKVFVGDGTRYLPDGGPLDHDINPWSSTFGAFTGWGAWWGGSVAYGPGVGTDSYGNGPVVYAGARNTDGENLRLSYRHACENPRQFRATRLAEAGPIGARDHGGCMNAVFFDGHVQALDDRASRDIDHWYPTGSVVEDSTDGMTPEPVGYVIP